ncbi:hypothetical protein [Paractinoplanes rishiriensis]|uniref:Plastocyanin-like domain-containing protein n=1 Tax=Paractinoplanes rishiriensis TaxID=1050105 RepID=A0A919MTL1_9ACTN|nr:hypothetical protein [Actinoplanes rishiriensis]GIE99366.1 hypothetical protein Ari01nite_68310 [Actinoplanes rishiriensis]
MRWATPAVAVAFLLAGCTTAEPARAVAGCSSAAPGVLAVESELLSGQAVPAPRRVEVPLGSTVQVRVTADKVVPIHVHGYEIEYDAAPGTPECVQFTADRAGVFDVEAHPGLLLVQLEVR